MKSYRTCLLYYVLLFTGFVLFGCKQAGGDFLSQNYQIKDDPVHALLSEGLSLPTNLGGGFYEFVDPPLYLVVNTSNVFKAFSANSSGELIGVNLEDIKNRRPLVCYIDRNCSWTVLQEVEKLLGSDAGRFFLAYNECWRGRCHKELLEVEYDVNKPDAFRALGIEIFKVSKGQVPDLNIE